MDMKMRTIERSESIYIRISVRLAQFSTVIVPFGSPILVVIAKGLFALVRARIYLRLGAVDDVFVVAFLVIMDSFTQNGIQ